VKPFYLSSETVLPFKCNVYRYSEACEAIFYYMCYPRLYFVNFNSIYPYTSMDIAFDRSFFFRWACTGMLCMTARGWVDDCFPTASGSLLPPQVFFGLLPSAFYQNFLLSSLAFGLVFCNLSHTHTVCPQRTRYTRCIQLLTLTRLQALQL
jgi:hypothetical protein